MLLTMRYFSKLHDQYGHLLDDHGQELADLSAVRRVAVDGIRSLICADVLKGELDLRGSLQVVDGAGGAVLTLRFDEAVMLQAETYKAERLPLCL